MHLIGMLDSPFVRRVAITLRLLGLPYEQRSVSVFRTYDEFRSINPVVKAPTLVCDDGTLLMDSTLIIDYLEALAGRSLMPADLAARRQHLKVIGLAMAAAEKTVQIVYETKLRPSDKQHAPWLERVQQQLNEAYSALEREAAGAPLDLHSQAGLTTAVTWRFTQIYGLAAAADFPAIAALSARAELLPEFIATPVG